MSVRQQIDPLRDGNPIVGPNRDPTPEFARKFNALADNVKIDTEELNSKVDEDIEVIAGAGLTGGGDLRADRTLNVGAGTGITVNADDVAIDLTAEAERIRDVIGVATVDSDTIDAIPDDAGDTITLEVKDNSIGADQLTATGVTPGTYGDSTHVAQIEVDADGRVISATEVAISGGGGGSGGMIPLVDGSEPPVFITDGAGVLILVGL